MKKLFLPFFPVALVCSAIAQTPSSSMVPAPGSAQISAPNPVMQPAKPNQGTPGNAGPVLTLEDAEQHALEHQPRLLPQNLRAQAAMRGVTEAQSNYYPLLYGNVTAVQSNGDSAVAAGAVTTSSISPRAAGGLTLVQLVTDFGRTTNLVRSARYSAQASS